MRKQLKRAYSVIKNSLGDSDISPWVSDNFYCIDRYYLSSLKDKYSHKCKRLFSVIKDCCEAHDCCPTATQLRERISAERVGFSYYELCSIRSLVAASAIIAIAECVKSGKRGYLLPNAIKLLHSLDDTEYDDMIPLLWRTEGIIANFEEDYDRFDLPTKAAYRSAIAKRALSRRISESSAAKELITLARQKKLPLGKLLFVPKTKYAVLWLMLSLSVFLLLSFFALYFVGAVGILLLIPFWIAASQIADSVVSLVIPPFYAPRYALDKIPDNAKTLVTVAALMSGGDGDNRVFESLERSYCMNPEKNIYYCLLADLPDSDTAYLLSDSAVINNAQARIDALNQRYGERFCLFFRERSYNKSEQRYGGYERKRGAVCELVSHIVKGKRHEYYGGDFIRDIKYLLTLDSDTNLSVGSVTELVSVALHPANRPILRNNTVESGYGIIQSTVRTELKSAYKTSFSRLISGAGGTDAYSNAAFSRSQSLVGSGSFCGKGLIDVSLFYSLAVNKLPDGLVLSHDVLEGHLLKTLAVTDITLTDSTPANAVSFFRRQHRWLRGDFQNLNFLFGKIFSPFAKLRILVTAVKHLSPVFVLASLVWGAFLKDTDGLLLFLLAFSELLLPFAVATVRFLLSGSPFAVFRYFSKASAELTQNLLRILFEIISTARKALLAAHALILAVIRSITRKKTLEWTTAAQAERLSSSLGKYVIDGALSSLVGLLLLAFAGAPFIKLCGLLFFIYPLVSLFLSRSVGGGDISEIRLTKKQNRLLTAHVGDMVRFYTDNVGEATNHLPPDNIQLSPVSDTAMRTSPTNIGFYLVSLLAARDFGLIDTKLLCDRAERCIESVEKMEKYRGNLYNWYDLNDLSVIGDHYVSAVDSGNFTVMLEVLKNGIPEYADEDTRVAPIARRIEAIISQTDLGVFYDKRKCLFRIGLNGKTERADGSCYDMLMSEARMTAYYAVAKHIVPKRHWQMLGRTLTHKNGYIGMMSWSGTAFEYLMPLLFLPLYRDSFIYESVAFAQSVQKSRQGVWGISESAFYSFDSEMHYQYKANGIQSLALRRVSANENIVSPYSTYLALCINGRDAFKNLTELENKGMYGKYGLYEALDLNNDSEGICVKSYMAHHVGMSIIACANAVFNNIFVRRFMSDPFISSASELLQEKIPTNTHIFDERVGTAAEEKRTAHTDSSSQKFDPTDCALLNRGDMTVTVNGLGHIGIICGERIVANTNFDPESLRFTPGVVFSRQGRAYGCAGLYAGADSSFEKNDRSVSHIVSSKEFSGRVRYSMSKVSNCLIVSTRAEAMKKYDISLVFEPVLEKQKSFLAHISFSRLFIESEYDTKKRILYFHRRSRIDGSYVFTLAVAPRDRDMEFEFSSSRENMERTSFGSPLDYAFEKTENRVGACIDPICLVRSSGCDGGRAVFLVTCAETKGECEKNIRLARSDKRELGLLPHGSIFKSLLSSLQFGSGPKPTESLTKSNIGDLWSRGISGDHPIALISLSERAITRTESVVKSFAELARCMIRCELIFVVSDSDKYNRPVESSLRSICREQNLLHFIGRNGGIFILRRESLNDDFYKTLVNSACYFADFYNDTLRQSLAIGQPIPIIESAESNLPITVPDGAVRAGNGYFIGDCYTVDKSKKAKLPYSFVLTGKRFSSVITQSSLGYTFYDNARECRIGSFYGDIGSLDNGERLFLYRDGKKYDLCAVSHKVEYKKGFAVYSGGIDGIEYSVTVTVHPKFPIKLIRVRYKDSARVKSVFSVNAVMGDSARAINSLGFTRNEINGNSLLVFKNNFGTTFSEGFGFMGVCGAGAWENGLELRSDSCDALFFLGACTTENAVREIAARVNHSFFDESLSMAEANACAMIPHFDFRTKSISNDILMRFFLPYQVAACRFYARGSFYQSGGAYGFRDQLQDCLTLVYADPKAVRTHIIRCCAHQYLDGSVMHWWHTRHKNGVNAGIRSKCSDDLLYLPLVVADYIEKTGDREVLSLNVRYLTSSPLGASGERYEYPELSDVSESIYRHCLRALACAERKGKNGLILMGSCDWNDAFSLVGERGIGESVFSSLLFVISAEAFMRVAEGFNDKETVEHYRESVGKIRQSVENCAFYGDRYARAFCDDGEILGIDQSEECKLDILSQSFAALANLDEQRTKTALTTAFKGLYDPQNRIFKLFSPPFSNGRARVGYIRGYVKGIRENGGQYSHGALWGALGFLRAGMVEEALLVLDCVNPISRHFDKSLSQKYKAEPYAVAADIYSGDFAGRGGWSWYTGEASWYYRIMLEYVLGLKLGANGTLISACPRIEFEGELELNGKRLFVTASRENETALFNGAEAVFPLVLESPENTLFLPVK